MGAVYSALGKVYMVIDNNLKQTKVAFWGNSLRVLRAACDLVKIKTCYVERERFSPDFSNFCDISSIYCFFWSLVIIGYKFFPNFSLYETPILEVINA